MNKIEFLDTLRAKSSGNYKRYLKSPLRYAGGKSLAVGLIVELLPENIKKLSSPFMGGGSVEIALSKELEIDVVGYDKFDLLVNYWNHQLHHQEEMFQYLDKIEPTRENFLKIKDILKEHWNGETGYDGKLDPLEAACLYFYNMQLSFGPLFVGHTSHIYHNRKKYNSYLEKVRNFRDDHLTVKCKSFEESIPENQGTFLYLDPPYYMDGNSKVKRGMYPNHEPPIYHVGFDHEKLLSLLKNHKGGFILSYNNCDVIREMYKDFEIIDKKWNYSMGIGATKGEELLIIG